MNYLRSTAELLAEHLRAAIERGELVEPLPSIHDWSSKLGVSHGTLEGAIQILKREGVIRTRPRKGIYIARPASSRRRLRQPPTARWIFCGLTWKKSPNIPEILGTVTQKLSEHGIHVSIEMLNDTRLRALHGKGEVSHEMLVLASFPREHQRLFSNFRRSALLLGAPASGVELPYVFIDGVVDAAGFHRHRTSARRPVALLRAVSRRAVAGPAARPLKRLAWLARLLPATSGDIQPGRVPRALGCRRFSKF